MKPTCTPVALCGPDEPDQRLGFGGRVLDYTGQPLSNVAVVAYNADHRGYYNPPNSRTRVPRIRGVAVTDERGQFMFSTVRPGSYRNSTKPAHIHLSVTAPAHHTRYLTYWFDDDPFVTPQRRAQASRSDEVVIVTLNPRADDTMGFMHDVRLEGN